SVIRRGRYKMRAEDIAVLSVYSALFIFVLFQKIIGNMSFVFEPEIYIKRLSMPAVICFLFFGMIPSVINLKENVQWKLSRSKA
ncbi:MAG: hypothetical protein K6C14_08345, partial [Eubacterium sp.]|nr:hypothetical protein [Eubacterium sp.]